MLNMLERASYFKDACLIFVVINVNKGRIIVVKSVEIGYAIFRGDALCIVAQWSN